MPLEDYFEFENFDTPHGKSGADPNQGTSDFH